MRRVLLAAALVGLASGTAGAEPVRLDEAGLQEVTAGLAGLDGLLNVNVNIATPVNVNNLVGVDNQIDVNNQIGNAVAVGVVNVAAAFANGVAAVGGVTADLGLFGVGGALAP